MRTLFQSVEPCKEPHLNILNPQSWLQVERDKLSKLSTQSSSIGSLIKVPDPPIFPFFKPLDYVEVLAQIHEELESCSPHEKATLYLLQYQVFRGLGEVKLTHRSLHSAWLNAGTVHEKIVFGSWLKYEKKGEEHIFDLLSSCTKWVQEFGPINDASELPYKFSLEWYENEEAGECQEFKNVTFLIGDDKVHCNRKKIAALSSPFYTMLNGCFTESYCDEIDLSLNNISSVGMRAISEFSETGCLDEVPLDLLLEILSFANQFCCEKLKDASDRKLASLVCSREDALELLEFALEENSPILATSCLEVFLYELPNSLDDERVVEILGNLDEQQTSIMTGAASFSLFCLLSEVSMSLDPRSGRTLRFLERLLGFARDNRQRILSFHQLGCIKLLREEYDDATSFFEEAVKAGHVYSAAGLARIRHIKGHRNWSYKKLSSIISSSTTPLGWMYQERSLYSDSDKRWEDLQKATELDPMLTYPFLYRAASLMMKQESETALLEINRILGFKLELECLELRFCFYLVMENYPAALGDIQVILTLSPEYRVFDGRVAASHLRTLLCEHVENWSTADCWLQLYDRWSSVDDIGSLSVIYQMLEADSAKGVLFFRQSLLLLRLNCPEAAMRSLHLACEHASSDDERLVYEGWILYDTDHCEEGLQKAEESIRLKRTFEAFFLKAYALADSNQDPSFSSTVISLLEEALKCPSDRLRKGQALNNLGSVYVDCGQLDLAADCYINALKIGHTRAHQGLARVHFLRNDRAAAHDEMTKLIEKAQNNASAYEKRSEYCERDFAKADLDMVTQLDPLRIYPYRYRAAVLMDDQKEKEAIAELSGAIAFKADVHLLHLRAAFHEHVGDVMSALRDCRAALSVDPNHQEMLELHGRVNSHEP